jgi:hypothetical protein
VATDTRAGQTAAARNGVIERVDVIGCDAFAVAEF